MPSSLSEIIRQKSFLEAGGRPEGARDIDKANTIVGTVQGISDRQTALIKERLAQKKTELETQGLERGLTPVNKLSSEVPAGAYGDFTTDENAKFGLLGFRKAQTEKIVTDPTRMTLGDLFPQSDDNALKEQFGPLVSRKTPYSVANQFGKMNLQKLRGERMFPVTALSPEGQAAARASGMPDYIPETTARIINGANPIRFPTAEESASVATSESIADKIGQVANLLPEVGDKALGFGKYQINKYGQYVPGVSSDPKIVDFYTNIQSINNAMIYYMSGKQINEQEMQRIKAELLEPELNQDAFVARMASVMRNFDYLKTLKNKAITTPGKRSPLPVVGPSAPTNPATSGKTRSGIAFTVEP